MGTEGRRATLSMYSPLAAIIRRPAITVPLDATVRESLERMEQSRAGFVVVTDRARELPLGIFTLHDLVRRVTLPGGDLQQPIVAAMTGGLVTLRPQATAHQAALLMARNGMGHVVVVDAGGRLVGVVTRDDLFGLQQVGVGEMTGEIAAAKDLPALQRAAGEIRRLTIGLMAQGISAELLTHFTSTLTDLLTIRIIEVTLDEHELPPVPFCWIALGSEGRLEQTFATDQDNGIIFEAEEEDVAEVRAALLPFARAVNERLDACGFTLCKGDIMAGNPRWCLTLAEWRRSFGRWIYEPSQQDLLNAAIFFDLRPIYGADRLAEELREWLLAAAADRPLFLRFMADNALKCQPPLGTIRDFVFDNRAKDFPHTLELKMYGSRPFVDAARILSLANRVPHTSTAERLRAVADAGHLGTGSVTAMIDGFYFIHLLRLRNQATARGTADGANRVDPRDLNDLDRHILKEAFRQARKLQNKLVLDYQL
ncbi:MAG: CBS domain-containing protein [Acidobacteria bacterium]|nr:MAG: CBS domain-containing protein [Acidobacteriota bacterium]